MKNTIIYILIFILICFSIPIMFTKKTKKTMSKDFTYNNDNEISIKKVDNSKDKFANIKLLHSKTGVVENININEYLCNVVSAEMPANFDKEALKAQAVVARTYTIYKVLNKKHENADICDDSSCCQAWISKEDRFNKWEENSRESNWEKICDSVYSTSGKIITYDNKPINAFFHSNSGGITELPVNVWGGTNYPYLQSVETSGEDGYKQYLSEINLTYDELLNKLKEKYPDIEIDLNDNESIKILEYTESKRVKTIKLGNHNLSGVEARTIFGLKSTKFEVEKNDNNIKFKVIGNGHGVGMSQTGADAMAKSGASFEDIIKHFYKDVEIKDVNSI